MAEIGTKFGLGGSGGINFKEPWKLRPYISPTNMLNVYDSGGTVRNQATTEFFTQMATRGLQDTTNWTADTYKTLLTVSSGKGEVAAIIGPIAGGSETTTFEITVDGVLTEMAVSGLASGSRACLLAAYQDDQEYTTALATVKPVDEALAASKAIWSSLANVNEPCVLPWKALRGIPLLQFNTSLLIRAKHSANITNSTATAYSAVMYRLGL